MAHLCSFFWPRDQAQLDAASVSSIQVVGVVEALIQNADTLFPGGEVPVFVNVSPYALICPAGCPPDLASVPGGLIMRPGANCLSAVSLTVSPVQRG